MADWAYGVMALGNIARRFPDTAYSRLAKSLQNEWNYLHQVTSGNGNLYKTTKKEIREDFLPELLEYPSIGGNLRKNISLKLK